MEENQNNHLVFQFFIVLFVLFLFGFFNYVISLSETQKNMSREGRILIPTTQTSLIPQITAKQR